MVSILCLCSHSEIYRESMTQTLKIIYLVNLCAIYCLSHNKICQNYNLNFFRLSQCNNSHAIFVQNKLAKLYSY